MMNININNPEFLLSVLKEEVVNRTRYLVSQGIAYDEEWRATFVELFQVIEQLEIPVGDKLEEYMNDENSSQIVGRDEFISRVESASAETKEISIKSHEHRLALKYPLGLSVTLGKGKTIWTVDGYKGQMVHVSREGAGKNSMYTTPEKIKFIRNQFVQNEEH